MQEVIEFRPLTPGDYDRVLALWLICDGVEVAEGDDRGSFVRYLERNRGLSFAATSEGLVVAAALCGHDGRRGLIYHLAVAPEYRGKGVGSRILETCLAGLRGCGISRVVILVAEDNPSGRGFWAAQGFEPISGALPLGLDLT